MTTYINLPEQGGGSEYWGDAVANFAALPLTGLTGEIRQTIDTEDLYRFNGTTWIFYLNPSGDVEGPSSATDNAAARFDGTTGKLIQNSAVIISDTGDLSGIGTLGLSGPITDASQTASRALVTNGSKAFVSSATTAAELGFVSGVTSAIQTQINTKVTGPASATDTAVVRYDGTTGKLVKDSAIFITDAGNLGVGITPAAIRLRVQGQGTAYTDKVVKVINSSSQAIATMTADGRTYLGADDGSGAVLNVNLLGANTTGFLAAFNDLTGSLRIPSSTGFFSTSATFSFGASGFGATIFIDTPTMNEILNIKGTSVSIGTTTSAAQLLVQSVAVGTKTLVARAQVSQTATLQEWQNSSGTALSVVDKDGRMAVGGATITTSATLDVSGTTGAFMPPRLTTTQRDALTGANGMMIYNTSTDRFQGYVAGAWTDLHGWGA